MISVRQQPNPTTQSIVTEHWIRLILTYARHRKLFVLCVEDSEIVRSDWEEILHNGRINRISDITKKCFLILTMKLQGRCHHHTCLIYSR